MTCTFCRNKRITRRVWLTVKLSLYQKNKQRGKSFVFLPTDTSNCTLSKAYESNKLTGLSLHAYLLSSPMLMEFSIKVTCPGFLPSQTPLTRPWYREDLPMVLTELELSIETSTSSKLLTLFSVPHSKLLTFPRKVHVKLNEEPRTAVTFLPL